MSTKLLLPYDGSPAAQRAAELVAGYAGDKRALALTLLNVQSRPVSLWPEASAATGAIEAALLDEGRSTLAQAKSRLESAAFTVHAEVRLGLAAQTIVREARHADAILMGTRGAGVVHG